MKRKLVIAVSLFVLLFVAQFVPFIPDGVTYRRVTAPSDRFCGDAPAPLRCGRDDLVSAHEVEGETAELYAVHRGQLFLRVRRTYGAVVLVTGLRLDTWPEERIAQLRHDHPELEPLWPNPDRRDGGVAWTEK